MLRQGQREPGSIRESILEPFWPPAPGSKVQDSGFNGWRERFSVFRYLNPFRRYLTSELLNVEPLNQATGTWNSKPENEWQKPDWQ